MIPLDERGAAGVFEEIPSIMIVIVATFLFLLSFTNGLASHSWFQEETEAISRLDEFCTSILTYEPLLYDSKRGILDASKLNENARQGLSQHFSPELMGFHFNITLVDVGSYDEKYGWFAGEEPSNSSMTRTTIVPAVVANEFGQHHPVLLTVTTWR
jgi:hypothetical protein